MNNRGQINQLPPTIICETLIVLIVNEQKITSAFYLYN